LILTRLTISPGFALLWLFGAGLGGCGRRSGLNRSCRGGLGLGRSADRSGVSGSIALVVAVVAVVVAFEFLLQAGRGTVGLGLAIAIAATAAATAATTATAFAFTGAFASREAGGLTIDGLFAGSGRHGVLGVDQASDGGGVEHFRLVGLDMDDGGGSGTGCSGQRDGFEVTGDGGGIEHFRLGFADAGRGGRWSGVHLGDGGDFLLDRRVGIAFDAGSAGQDGAQFLDQHLAAHAAAVVDLMFASEFTQSLDAELGQLDVIRHGH
jgi:hypothetical protein